MSEIEELYHKIDEMMCLQFSKGSSIEHCKGYILMDVLQLFEEKHPEFKRMTVEEFREKHPLYVIR